MASLASLIEPANFPKLRSKRKRPEGIGSPPVRPGELKALETFLAAVVDASLEPTGLYTEKPGSEPAKDTAERDIE